MKEIKLSEVKNGEIFNVGGFEFIKFSDENGETVAVAKDTVFRSEFGTNNNLAESKIMEKLEKEVLPKLSEAIGEENILEYENKLGLYAKLESTHNIIEEATLKLKKINEELKNDNN